MKIIIRNQGILKTKYKHDTFPEVSLINSESFRPFKIGTGQNVTLDTTRMRIIV